MGNGWRNNVQCPDASKFMLDLNGSPWAESGLVNRFRELYGKLRYEQINKSMRLVWNKQSRKSEQSVDRLLRHRVDDVVFERG